jgi:tetratricopeptide (TPR) repeat protein
VVLLNHHAPLLADVDERRALDLRRVRILAGQLGTPNLAIEAAQQALERYGRDAALLEVLSEAARAAGDERVLADTRAAQAESAELAGDAAARLRYVTEAAALYRALGDTAAAQALARKLTVAELVQLGDPTERAEALAALVATARAAGDDTVEREALVAQWKDGHAGDDRSRLLTLLQRAEDQDAAAAVAFELFEAERARGGALAVALEPVRATAHSTEALARLARALASSAGATDGGEAESWLREAATIHGDLGDFTASAEVLVTALARWPANETLFRDVEMLLEDLGDRVRLRQVLEQHLDTRVDEARLPVLRKLVRVCEELGDEAAVQLLLAEERRLEPASAARVNMQTLVRTVVPGGGQAAAAALDEAVAAAERELDDTPADEVVRIRAARRRLGELYRDAGRFAESYALLETVLSEEPDNAAVVAMLVEVAHGDGRWLETAQLLDRLSHLTAAPAERAVLLHRAGDLQLVRLRDKDAASTAYLEAIDLDPTHVPTVRRLVDYFFSEGDWASTAEMAATLDDEGAFAVDETGAGTRARAVLATALAGDVRRAVTLGAALDDGAGAAALAQAALDLVTRGEAIEAVGDTLALVAGIGRRSAVVRQRLEERGASDGAAAALAARLAR